MSVVTRQQLADIRNCDPSYVSKEKLPKSKNGKYDLTNEEVREFILRPLRRELEREYKHQKKTDTTGLIEDELGDELTREQIEYKRKQNLKLDLAIEKEKKELIPVDLMAIWIGYFASGIRTNFLNIGNRVARGNTALRDRIEKEIRKAIEKTISSAESGLEKEGKKIIDQLNHS